MIDWTNFAVQAALIESIGTIFATIVAAIFASIIGKKFRDRDKLKEHLDLAISDIAYLLQVEDEHCTMNKERTSRTSKLVVRQIVSNRGLKWSGKFTPGRAKSLNKNDSIL